MENIIRWVSCAERLPQHRQRVLVWHSDDGLEFYSLLVFNTHTGDWIGLEKNEWPTHWSVGLMPPAKD